MIMIDFHNLFVNYDEDDDDDVQNVFESMCVYYMLSSQSAYFNFKKVRK